MEDKASSRGGTGAPAAVQMLVDVGAADTVYSDVYLGRARELLEGVLPRVQYDAMKAANHDIDEAVKQSKIAAMQQNWRQVDELAGRVEQLRHSAQAHATLAALAAKVYDANSVRIDPFSPGVQALPGGDRDLADLRDTLVEKLKALAEADAPSAAFYQARRTFLAGLSLTSKSPTTVVASGRNSAEIEQLAQQAAQRGDMSLLRRYAQQLAALQQQEAAAPNTAVSAGAAAPVGRASHRCPVDLSAPFPDAIAPRAQALGLAAVRTGPVAQAAPLFDYIGERIWHSSLSEIEDEQEGTVRAEAVVDELKFPAEVSGTIKVLVGQFLRNVFINSGGARYLPPFADEVVLLEDFPEIPDPPITSPLLAALGLTCRRGLARQEIEDALLSNAPSVVRDQLGLDTNEFRLVCISQDLYMRAGRDRGWGQQQQWTHFDGYQVLKGGMLRALAGGDVRYGGLTDLVSISATDRRDSVVLRLALIRRARQVARWL